MKSEGVRGVYCAVCDPSATVDAAPRSSPSPNARAAPIAPAIGAGRHHVRLRVRRQQTPTSADNLWIAQDRAIILEVDEGCGNPSYPAECDVAWAVDMNTALVQLYQKCGYNGGMVPHVILLRFNPDGSWM